MEFWQRHSTAMLIASIVMLLIVLVVGSSVSGASRWIALGPLRIQPAEFTKLSLFCYIANYLVRKGDEVRNNLRGFLKPMGVIFVLAILLLAQPDLGTVVVLFATTLAMLFLAGGQAVAVHRHYRYGDLGGRNADSRRAVSYSPRNLFLEPVGRSVWQRLSVDPVADGLWSWRNVGGKAWAIRCRNWSICRRRIPISSSPLSAKSSGYIGVVLALLMVFFVAFRAMSIGRKALEIDHRFSGFLACAIGIWFSFQALVNVGAAAGMLPTKGLTLPLISYGGSSLLIMSTAIMLPLRIDYETRLEKAQAFTRGVR